MLQRLLQNPLWRPDLESFDSLHNVARSSQIQEMGMALGYVLIEGLSVIDQTEAMKPSDNYHPPGRATKSYFFLMRIEPRRKYDGRLRSRELIQTTISRNSNHWSVVCQEQQRKL